MDPLHKAFVVHTLPVVYACKSRQRLVYVARTLVCCLIRFVIAVFVFIRAFAFYDVFEGGGPFTLENLSPCGPFAMMNRNAKSVRSPFFWRPHVLVSLPLQILRCKLRTMALFKLMFLAASAGICLANS